MPFTNSRCVSDMSIHLLKPRQDRTGLTEHIPPGHSGRQLIHLALVLICLTPAWRWPQSALLWWGWRAVQGWDRDFRGREGDEGWGQHQHKDGKLRWECGSGRGQIQLGLGSVLGFMFGLRDWSLREQIHFTNLHRHKERLNTKGKSQDRWRHFKLI